MNTESPVGRCKATDPDPSTTAPLRRDLLRAISEGLPPGTLRLEQLLDRIERTR